MQHAYSSQMQKGGIVPRTSKTEELPMAKAQDFTTVMKDIMGAFPVDTKAMEDAFKNQAALSEKLSGVALDAAEKSAELSSKWTKETLAKMSDMTKAKAEPADYAKALTDFASANAEVAAENMAAFAEIAKKVQMDTVELMMAAGKDMQEDAAKAVKKATDDATAAAKKATTVK
ncbi:hypothetical protein GCM10011315_04340 [Roseovarius pacificus]|nr:hypothetical protein GCM10011315_04340 [Roseovarius pacificus]